MPSLREQLGTKLTIHLVGGQVIVTNDDRIDDLSDLEAILSEPARPHWCQLGDALVFTQAIAGVELGD